MLRLVLHSAAIVGLCLFVFFTIPHMFILETLCFWLYDVRETHPIWKFSDFLFSSKLTKASVTQQLRELTKGEKNPASAAEVAQQDSVSLYIIK